VSSCSPSIHRSQWCHLVPLLYKGASDVILFPFYTQKPVMSSCSLYIYKSQWCHPVAPLYTGASGVILFPSHIQDVSERISNVLESYLSIIFNNNKSIYVQVQLSHSTFVQLFIGERHHIFFLITIYIYIYVYIGCLLGHCTVWL
jgi:hypothetical protein